MAFHTSIPFASLTSVASGRELSREPPDGDAGAVQKAAETLAAPCDAVTELGFWFSAAQPTLVAERGSVAFGPLWALLGGHHRRPDLALWRLHLRLP